MFRRPTATTDTASSTALDEHGSRRARHSRRAQRREAADTAAQQARLDRLQRRLEEVASVTAVETSPRASAIDDAAARRDPMTRPFPMAFGTAAAPRDETGRRVRGVEHYATTARSA